MKTNFKSLTKYLCKKDIFCQEQNIYVKSIKYEYCLQNSYLADIGVLSIDELEAVLILPLATELDGFLGDDDPNPTGVLRVEALPPTPDLMLEDLLTEDPLGESSESNEILDPVLDGGLEPFLPMAADWRLDWNPIC